MFTMKLSETLKKSLILANNLNTISDATFKCLLENTFAVLTGDNEIHNSNNLYNSKPDLVKEIYAALLSATANFVRNGEPTENVAQYLSNDCNFTLARSNLYQELYAKNRNDVEEALLNIGNNLSHITDVTWKIDYIIKSSAMEHNGGPLFRIGLQSEKFDSITNSKKMEIISFTCNSQELQDLVYKLKDAVRHCQRIAAEH